MTLDGALSKLFSPWDASRILFHDQDLIAVDKPFGVSTHAPEPHYKDDARSRLAAFLKAQGADTYLGIHQRLDKDTSGVLVFTRRKEANRDVAQAFEQRHVDKTYVACVTGYKGPSQGVLEHKIAPGEGGAMRALPMRSKVGQHAVTRYRVVERRSDRVLLELVPETGRTHQIRAQLAAIGAPIAGDVLYGGQPFRRMLLHASSLALPKALGKKVFRAEAPSVFGAWMRGESEGVPREAKAIEALMREAASLRYGLFVDGHTTAFRVVNGAGDGLPGVDVDVYGDHLVVALSGDEALEAREPVLDAAHALGAAGVYLKVRPKHASVIVDPKRDDVAPKEPVRGGPAPEGMTILELGLPYRVRLGEGLSTGIFLDQRENRGRVRALAKGAKVLNLFAYTGAFTVAAVAGGAKASVTVDVSAGACAWAEENLAAIGADRDKHVVVAADALTWLDQAAKGEDRYDLALCDPPSFATTKKTRFSAESDYRMLAAKVIRLLAPGGRLLASTNHRGIPRQKFRRFLHEAARDAGRVVTQMKDLPDPEDFPPVPGRPSHLTSVLVTFA